MKCMVCGTETKPCCPLCFCENCVKTPEAELVRKQHHKFIQQIITEVKVEHGMRMIFQRVEEGGVEMPNNE